jgi:hypothetical protein
MPLTYQYLVQEMRANKVTFIMNGARRHLTLVVLLAAIVLLGQTIRLSPPIVSSSPAKCSGEFIGSSVAPRTTGILEVDQPLQKDLRKSQRSHKSEMERLELLGSDTVPNIDQFWVKEKQVPTPQARFLLDYVVAGFPKCGTTTIGQWLSSHPLIKDTAEEEYYVWTKDLNYTTNKLYESLLVPWGKEEKITEVVRGFRCPHQVHTEWGIGMLSEVFTEAKVIISIRHPVLWFQSYYNFRLEQNDTHLLKGSPNDLIGDLQGNWRSDISPWLLQTATAEFHRYLAAMKKTPLSDPLELSLLSPFWNRNWNISHLPRMPNPVFLCEISQFSDKNMTRRTLFRKDLQSFLGLATEFPPIPHVRPQNADTAFNRDKMINICDEQYAPVRAELMNVAQHSSLWLRRYFMKSNDVYYSSGEYLDELLQRWMVDPCN